MCKECWGLNIVRRGDNKMRSAKAFNGGNESKGISLADVWTVWLVWPLIDSVVPPGVTKTAMESGREQQREGGPSYLKVFHSMKKL